MIARRAVLAAGLSLAAAPAFAIDPGVAKGRYRKEGVDLNLTHAVALGLDNVEGMLDTPKEMRVLLTDAEVPPAALYGLVFPPVWNMARAGTVRGLLLSFDPADRTSLHAVVLTKPEAGYSLANLSLSASEGLWSRLDVSPTRIVGELKPDASEDITLSFSAPVFSNAVKADLKGPAAQASEPVKVLIARAEAVGRGDMAAAYALSTPESAAQMKVLPPEVMQMAKKEMPSLIRGLKGAQRVVIREQTAAIMVGKGEWANVTLIDGAWKAAD